MDMFEGMVWRLMDTLLAPGSKARAFSYDYDGPTRSSGIHWIYLDLHGFWIYSTTHIVYHIDIDMFIYLYAFLIISSYSI